MRIIQQIPQAMLQSLGFMALLFVVFEAVLFWFKPSSNRAYLLAIVCYVTAFIHFLTEIHGAHAFMRPKMFLPVSNQLHWITFIGLLYLVIVVIYLLHLIYRWILLVQLKQKADFSVATDLATWAKSQMLAAGSKRKIHIGFSNQVAGPVTFGWLEPIILMPFSILNQVPQEEIKYIILHEIAHIIRHDFIIHIGLELVQIILCFNPFAYYFRKKIHIEREKACDDWVVANTQAPLMYTKALYQLAKYSYNNKHNLSLAAAEKVSELMVRIKQINGLKTTSNPTSSIWLKSCIGLGMTTLLLWQINLSTPSTSMRYQKIVSTQVKANHITSSKLVKKSEPSIKATSKLSITFNQPTLVKTDSVYQELVQATLEWIKARANNNSQVVLTQFEDNKVLDDYTVAEQLLLRAVLHKYELKRTILAKTISKANSQEEAINLVKNSKEWVELQQYEKWANSFLKQHPTLMDSSQELSDF